MPLLPDSKLERHAFLLHARQVQLEGCHALAILSQRCSRCGDRPPSVGPRTPLPSPNLIPVPALFGRVRRSLTSRSGPDDQALSR